MSKKISELTQSTSVQGTEMIPFEKNGANGYITASLLKTTVDSSVSDISENPVQNKAGKKYVDDSFTQIENILDVINGESVITIGGLPVVSNTAATVTVPSDWNILYLFPNATTVNLTLNTPPANEEQQIVVRIGPNSASAPVINVTSNGTVLWGNGEKLIPDEAGVMYELNIAYSNSRYVILGAKFKVNET